MIYMKQKTTINNQGVGFLGLLALLFVAAKLFGVIGWSWWLVLLPAYVIPAILLSAGAFAAVLWLVATAIDSQKRKRRMKANIRHGS